MEEEDHDNLILRSRGRRCALVCLGLLLAASQAGWAETPEPPDPRPQKPAWQYAGFVDVGYLLDFNHPSNGLFRSRGTTWHLDEADLNMTAASIKKPAAPSSRWGVELTAQAGKDTEVFGFSATAPNLDGYKVLRHLGPTNVSYLAPVGKGLTLQGGIFSSLIGYDSLYAKDNFHYTRPWGADFTPYLMLGVNGSYPVNDRVTVTAGAVNGYWHLANANGVPSVVGQVAYKATRCLTLKETVLVGPHQPVTSIQFWRFLADSIAEWKKDRVTVALEYQFSRERVDGAARSHALWMAGQLPVRWTLGGPWSISVRPEAAWDRNGRWTLSRQTVKAVTTGVEYRLAYRRSTTLLRLEHRWDDSRGPDGGFFTNRDMRSGQPRLTPGQHLLVFGLIATFDSSNRP